MAQRDWRIQKIHENFLRDLDDIKFKRIANGLEKINKPASIKRLTLGITRAPIWQDLKNMLSVAPMPQEQIKRRMLNNRQGSLMNVMASGVTLILIIIVAFVLLIMGVIGLYGFGVITDNLINIPSTNTTDISQAAETTFGNYNIAFQQFRWISFAIIFGMLIGFIIANYGLRAHPGLFVFWVIISAVAVLFSIFISRSYEALYNSGGILGATFQSFSGASYLVLYLPIFTTVAALIGCIFMFVRLKSIGEEAVI